MYKWILGDFKHYNKSMVILETNKKSKDWDKEYDTFKFTLNGVHNNSSEYYKYRKVSEFNCTVFSTNNGIVFTNKNNIPIFIYNGKFTENYYYTTDYSDEYGINNAYQGERLLNCKEVDTEINKFKKLQNMFSSLNR